MLVFIICVYEKNLKHRTANKLFSPITNFDYTWHTKRGFYFKIHWIFVEYITGICLLLTGTVPETASSGNVK